MYALSDLSLSRRLERCEAKSNAAFVEARGRIAPASGATWMERAGAYAMFDGAGSPVTQTFGLGIFETPAAEDLAAIERFFEERGAAVVHEVSPLVSMETVELLVTRGYRPMEFSSVMHRPLDAASIEHRDSAVRARIMAPDEVALWARTAGEGWSEYAELGSFMDDFGRVSASSQGNVAFFAELEGRPVGTGALSIHDGVALFAGASTIPSARKQGAQRALLEARLRHAAEHGCDLAMMGAAPGSSSQRNAERQGFRIAYTRVKWGKP
jgi:GNAT superfamily N-acetyltransferase